MNNHQLVLSPLYQLHAPYRPSDPYVSNIHIAEINAIKSSSMLLATLKDRDFAPAGFNRLGDEIFAINPKAVVALDYLCEQLCLDVCEAGGAGKHHFNKQRLQPVLNPSSISSVHGLSIAPIRQELLDKLGMPCPELLRVALHTELAPLYAHGTRDQLVRIFERVQGMARDLVYWMIVARRRSALWGDALGWYWSDSGIVNFTDALLGLPGVQETREIAHGIARVTPIPDSGKEPIVSALDQLRTDYPDSTTSTPCNLTTTSLPMDASVSDVDPPTQRNQQLLLEYPERKLIEYPGFPLTIPLIARNATAENLDHEEGITTPHPIPTALNDNSRVERSEQLRIEYPERKLIEYPGYRFSIPPIKQQTQGGPGV